MSKNEKAKTPLIPTGDAEVAKPRIPKLYTAADLVEMGVFTTEQNAANERYQGTGPKFMKLGEGKNGRIRYTEDDVVEWLSTRSRQSTNDN